MKNGRGRTTHKAKLAYGKRLVGSRVVPHKTELNIVATIKKMYVQEGLGPVTIARLLNTMKLPTKRRGKKWGHSVVISILERENVYKQSRKSPRQQEQ